MTCRAREVYEALRGMSAFNLPPDAYKVGANQYGQRYAFPDGSRLRVGGILERIEWRIRPGGPGAVRGLWGRGQSAEVRA